MRRGLLQQIEGDSVLIDGTWMTVEQAQYIPQRTNITVDYDLNPSDPALITFIREVTAGGYQPRGRGVPPRGSRGIRPPSSGTSYAGGRRSNSSAQIIRQAVLKAAGDAVDSAGKTPDQIAQDIIDIATRLEQWVTEA